MITPNFPQNETLVNLAVAQLERNQRVAKLLTDAAGKTVVGSVERTSQLATSLTHEVVDMVTASAEAAAELARATLTTLGVSEAPKAAAAKK